MAPQPPRTDEIRKLVHALREPVGAFAINVALLDDERLSDDGRERIEAILVNIRHMSEAISAITARSGLELGDSSPAPRHSGSAPPP